MAGLAGWRIGRRGALGVALGVACAVGLRLAPAAAGGGGVAESQKYLHTISRGGGSSRVKNMQSRHGSGRSGHWAGGGGGGPHAPVSAHSLAAGLDSPSFTTIHLSPSEHSDSAHKREFFCITRGAVECDRSCMASPPPHCCPALPIECETHTGTRAG